MKRSDWIWVWIALASLAAISLLVFGAYFSQRTRNASPVTELAPVASLTAAPATAALPYPVEPTLRYDLAPSGKIVFTCQLAGDQICIMNADGSGFRQLTSDSYRHWFPSLAPGGNNVLFSAFAGTNTYEIYELALDGDIRQLTHSLGVLLAPEVSPDGSRIVFGWGDGLGENAIWMMERDGSNPHPIYGPPNGSGWDPTWSPDGEYILFASLDPAEQVQLFRITPDGTGLTQLTDFDGLRGRSDWSPTGDVFATYAGAPWLREIYFFEFDGAVRSQVTAGGNNLAPSFSPDGRWIAFTSYMDNYQDDNGCEIYILRIRDGHTIRLTYNNYCDWQPRWGP